MVRSTGFFTLQGGWFPSGTTGTTKKPAPGDGQERAGIFQYWGGQSTCQPSSALPLKEWNRMDVRR